MTDFGIWTENDGGFVETQFYSRAAAQKRIQELIAEDPDNADDLRALELCADHEEQPVDGCEECDAEDEDDE